MLQSPSICPPNKMKTESSKENTSTLNGNYVQKGHKCFLMCIVCKLEEEMLKEPFNKAALRKHLDDVNDKRKRI